MLQFGEERSDNDRGLDVVSFGGSAVEQTIRSENKYYLFD